MKQSFYICVTALFMQTLAGWGCNQPKVAGKEKVTAKAEKVDHAAMHHHDPTADTGLAKPENMPMNGQQEPDTTDPSYWNTLPTNYTVIAAQQTVKPILRNVSYTAAANGYVTIDNRRNKKVSVRTAGRIERLYVRYNYQYVRKGEKILELYSPELSTYLAEYRYILQGNDSVLISRARQKLLLLGLRPSQINAMAKSGAVSSAISIYSPYEGYVLFSPSGGNNMPAAPSTAGMAPTNSSLNTEFASLPDNSIREGMYLNKDQTIFWMNDFKQVLGVLAFNKADEKYIRKGQTAVVQSELLPNQAFRTAIQLIEPVYDKGQRFTQARVYLPNTGKILRQNSLLTAQVFLEAQSLTIPQSSVQYLGRVAVVWVKVASTKDGNNVFQAKPVRLGRVSEGMTEVLQGLKENDWIAKDASYLTDSETIITVEK
ncbi:MAG TPA: efflux RND transporter periplasmic adaptor subunit [Flavisolibacter sp.]|nr:efflux RND transporter periplasmic adaptor subunit [Flavisolibacter sp.]